MQKKSSNIQKIRLDLQYKVFAKLFTLNKKAKSGFKSVDIKIFF